MKTWLVIVAMVILGVCLGIGIALARVDRWAWIGNPEVWTPPPEPVVEPPKGPHPTVEVDNPLYDFEVMDIAAKGRHDFVLTNVGQTLLVLSKGATSCSCTLSDLEKEKLQPGESTRVTLEWKSKGVPGDFRQSARINTNDPVNPAVTLSVTGRITQAVQVSPTQLILSRITAGETRTATARIYGFLPAPKLFEVEGYDAADPKLADSFEVAFEKMSPEQVKEQRYATSGYLAHVTVKPGLPLGAFQQRIVVRTNLTEIPKVEIPIQGSVGSEISIAGAGWNDDSGVLNLGLVNAQSGVERSVLIVARGEARNKVAFEIAEVSPPDLLKAELGKTVNVGETSTSRTPLKVRITSGSRPAAFFGPDPDKLGRIVLKTGNPKAPEILVLVRFAIEG